MTSDNTLRGYPEGFLSQCESALKAEYPAFLISLSQTYVPSLRINPQRANVLSMLGGVVTSAVEWEKNGFYTVGGFKPGLDPVHFAGGYYMQEASAMAPARVLRCEPGEVALDLCAAPGGKSGQMAADLNGAGALIANEPNDKRAKMLAGNLERLGVRNCCVVSENPQNLAEKWPLTFDAIMVDAPCSGEGMFRRDPASRGEWSQSRVAGCAERQREILKSAYKMLKPQGRLVYSTCTFNTHEDEENVRWFRDEFDVESVDFKLAGAGESENGSLKLWPHRVRGEGQFISLFKKCGDKPLSRDKTVAEESEVELKARKLLQAALGAELNEILEFDRARLFGDALHGISDDFPDLSGVRTYMLGVRLAIVKNGYAVPEHALSMALNAAKVKCLAVDAKTAADYMKGLEIPTSLRGWALVTYNALPLGFAKCSQGRAKNHLPKGLRV